MKLVAKGIVAKGVPGTSRASCCFPSIVQLEDGSLLCSWRAGSDKESADGAIWFAHSSDQGGHWKHWPLAMSSALERTPGEFHYGPVTRLDNGRLMIALMWVNRSNPSLAFFNPKTEGLLPVRPVFAQSTDNGLTWSEAGVMDLAPYHSPMPITGAVLKLPGGRLACQFEVNKDYFDERPWRHAAAMKISSDGGRTWPEAVEIANDPENRLMYWDQRHTVAGNRCVATFWTYDRQNNHDANIHISHSLDGGRSWLMPRDTGIVGQVAHPVLIEDSRLMLVYVDRFKSRSIRAKMSRDGGDSFEPEELVIYQQPGGARDRGEQSDSAAYLQDMQLWTFGRVDAVAGADEDVWIVFYAGGPSSTDIHWTRIRL